MRFVAIMLCLLSIAIGPLSAVMKASTPQAVPESEARQHLLPHKDAVYPAIARAAGIEGDVKIAVVIDGAGNVVSQKVLSGPPMLRQSALDATKKWRFTPFQASGVPTEVSTVLTISYHLENGATEPTATQKKAAQAWFPLWGKCRNSLKAHKTQGSLKGCKAALDMSSKAGHLRPSDQLAIVESHQEYGQALLAAGKLPKALKEENEAVDAAKAYLTDTDADYAIPFYWRAVIEYRLGDDNATSADLSIAEQTYRRAIKSIPVLKEEYSRDLAAILRQHASLFDRMGKSLQAAELRAEADSL